MSVATSPLPKSYKAQRVTAGFPQHIPVDTSHTPRRGRHRVGPLAHSAPKQQHSMSGNAGKDHVRIHPLTGFPIPNQAYSQPSPPFPMYPPTPPPPPGVSALAQSVVHGYNSRISQHNTPPDEQSDRSADGASKDLHIVPSSVETGNDMAASSDTAGAGKQVPAVDPTLPVHNKAMEFKLFSTARPHMRGFHFAWISCVACFFSWFAMSPLLASVKKPRCVDPLSDLCTVTCAITPMRNETFLGSDNDCRVCFPRDRDYGCGGLGLTDDQIFVSNAVGVCGTLILRLFGGPIIDKIGAKRFNVAVMIGTIWAQYWLCFVESYEEFVAARFFVSFLGASFVGTSAWCAVMFDKSLVGLVGATATGWGKVGAGLSYLIIPAIYRSLKDSGHDTEYAWRHTLLVPPSLLFVAAVCTYFFSDASPDEEQFTSKKSDDEHKAIVAHNKNKVAMHVAFGSAGANYRTWVMGLLFFASNGVDICMGSVVAYYFVKEFHMHQSEASLAGSSFGLMNLFARSLGGLLSDKLYIRQGLFGRVIATFVCTIGMGIGLVVFTSITDDNGGLLIAILVLMITSIFTQAAQGACYGIVPTIDPKYVGAVSGMVGACGNLGAISFNLLMAIGFRSAWTIIGYGCIVVAFTVFFVAIPDAQSRKKIRESLRKNPFKRPRRGSFEGHEYEQALPAMVLILAKKEEELSRNQELIEGLRTRLAHFTSHIPMSASYYQPLPLQPRHLPSRQ